MGVIHRFTGNKDKFDWEEVDVQSYNSSEIKGVIKKVLVGPKEGAPYFVLRYFEIEPGGWTSLDEHSHDHGVFILKGEGKVLLGQKEYKVKFGDVVYVSPNEKHQFKNTGNSPFGFICVIPNKELVK